jgi:DNA-binding CsgD family transcriptional regulator
MYSDKLETDGYKYYFKEYNIIVSEIPLDALVRKFDISEREKEVLVQLASGKSNSEIADSLFISINTVKTHIKNIYEKLNIKSRYELISLIKSNIN